MFYLWQCCNIHDFRNFQKCSEIPKISLLKCLNDRWFIFGLSVYNFTSIDVLAIGQDVIVRIKKAMFKPEVRET